jgi:predicted negative regulator of RcsB-dependent stress response
MATQHLDLEEQEQLANLKYFWQKYGFWISALVTAVALCYLAWTGWQWHQNNQSQKAAVLFDEFGKATATGDLAKSDRIFSDLKSQFASTAYTAQAALLSARANTDKGQAEAAKSALEWLVASSADEAYKDLARLRLAGLLIEAKNYDAAIALLSKDMSKPFEGLAADRLGDAHSLQGKNDEAKTQYQKAYQALPEDNDYRKMIEVKVARLGVDVTAKK